MSERDTARAIRRADPTLNDRRSSDALRPFGIPRTIGALLYGAFSLLLIIPMVRRLRRRPVWNALRLAALAIAVAMAFTGETWALFVAGVLAGGALVLGRTSDPEVERRLQKRHCAEYLLNGGEWVSVDGPIAVYLLLKGKHLLIVPREEAEGSGAEVRHAARVDSFHQICVDDEIYVPVYVSEAKQPPVREREVNRHQTSTVDLVSDTGDRLRFVYKGAFSRHLAETAAHAIYSVRERARGGAAEFAVLNSALS